MITMQIQSGVDRDTLETFKKLFLKIDPSAQITLSGEKNLETILSEFKSGESYDEIKSGMDADLKSYANGDLSGFEELGKGWKN